MERREAALGQGSQVPSSRSFSPLVSIVIPVYNGSNYLREAIDSALAQTYKNIEIVVVNDGSRDDGKTEEISLSYGPKIRYFNKPNGGCGSALNFGINEMRGEYFSWLSHDDVYYPRKIETQVEWMRRSGKTDEILYGDFDVIGPDGKWLDSVRTEPVDSKWFRAALLTTNLVHGCTLLIPKRCFDSESPFNENLRTTQDYNLWFALAKRHRFFHVPEILIKSREHAQQDTLKIWDLHRAEVDDLCLSFLKTIGDAEVAGFNGWKPNKFFRALGILHQLRGLPKSSEYSFKRAGSRIAIGDADVWAWIAGKVVRKSLSRLRRRLRA